MLIFVTFYVLGKVVDKTLDLKGSSNIAENQERKDYMEEELRILTEEERIEQIKQQHAYQLNVLEHVRTFMLMGYDTPDIYEALRSLRFTVSEDQLQFYRDFINDRRTKSIREINDELFKFLWEIEPPETAEEGKEDTEQTQEQPLEQYAMRVVFLNLLTDRIDFIASVLRQGKELDKVAMVNLGYEPYYVETLMNIIEKNPEKTSREMAGEAYRILYQEAKHAEPFMYCVDRMDIAGMLMASRERIEIALGMEEE